MRSCCCCFSRETITSTPLAARSHLHRSVGTNSKSLIMRGTRSLPLISRAFFNRPSKPAPAAPDMNMWSVAKHLVLKPFVYATVYSATTAALSLALFSAPQLAAAPVAAKGIALLANSCTAFGVGSAHGSFNGAHRLLIQERALVRLLPLGQIFDFLKSKDTKPLNMEVCYSFAATSARRRSNPHPPSPGVQSFCRQGQVLSPRAQVHPAISSSRSRLPRRAHAPRLFHLRNT
jgi:hypothetical protein